MSEGDIRDRVLESESIFKKSLPDVKRKWLSTICPNCGAKVDYEPKENFKGQLYCGNCGESFKLTRLDDF